MEHIHISGADAVCALAVSSAISRIGELLNDLGV